MLFDISLSHIFLDMSPQAKETKAKINKLDYIKLKSLCTAKETINKTKRQPTKWEKIFANDVFEKGLISKIYKQHIQPTTKKPLILKWTEELNRHFFQRRHINGQRVPKNVCNVTNHQEDVNQILNELSPHTC